MWTRTKCYLLVFTISIPLVLAGCSGDDGDTGDDEKGFADTNGSVQIKLKNGTSSKIWVQSATQNGNPSWFKIKNPSGKTLRTYYWRDPCACGASECPPFEPVPPRVTEVRPSRHTLVKLWDGVAWKTRQQDGDACQYRESVEPGTYQVEICWGSTKSQKNGGEVVKDPECRTQSVELPSEKGKKSTLKLTAGQE